MAELEDELATKVDMQPMTIVSERVISYPPDAVFAAFANPDRLELWWGPEGFTNTFHAFDFQAGGHWTFTMHAPDGSNFENTCTFREIVPAKRIELIHHLPVHVFALVMTFQPEGAGTRLKWHMDFEPNETNSAVRPFVQSGNEQNFDRLERHLNSYGVKP